jgi:hypothetical protein
MDSEKYPRRAARLRAGVSLVKVAAAANCALNTVQRYEVAPDSVQTAKRAALDTVYDRFEKPGLSAA